MSAEARFKGVIAPMLTPFDSDGNPDLKRFCEHAAWLISEGCTGLAPFGTTGEANSLGLDERMSLLDGLVNAGIDAERLLPGTGCCSIPDSVRLTQHAVQSGCGGVLMLPPFYYKAPIASDEGLYRYFADVIERVGDARLKIYLYHIPPMAQVGFSLDLIGRLIDAYPETVVGLKDSSGDWQNTKAIIDRFSGFTVFAGSEVFLLDTLRAGGAGCITATGNVNAREIRRVYDNWQSSEADELQTAITATRMAIQAFPVIPMMKALLALTRSDSAWRNVRPPFLTMDDSAARTLRDELAEAHGMNLELA
ncbi:4-hydroxy-tetrahydrodipicolinate synthase [bacterium MnTg02]|nr:4-hydroxy-tetrahydrodipicolinate synthase [bacterium MnTg02]